MRFTVLSYIYIETIEGSVKITLKEAIEELMGEVIIGREAMDKNHRFMAFAKFFDNECPILVHLHPSDAFAERYGMLGKPEAYYFPAQLNNTENHLPITYFGLEKGVTREQLKECFKDWNRGDNRIVSLSKGYRLNVGDAWNIPPGVLHAPGTLLTYEPQRASDIFVVLQNMVEGKPVDKDLLVRLIPKETPDDYDFILDMIDWEKNSDPEFKRKYKLEAIPAGEVEQMKGYFEKWIIYGTEFFSAKELTVYPRQTVEIKDAAAFGFVVIQGYGAMNGVAIETPGMIRFGEMTGDEGFVCDYAAKTGIKITNSSKFENLVILKHFGPENSEAPKNIN